MQDLINPSKVNDSNKLFTKNSVFRAWILAFRPRTLFLATGCIILGSGLAWHTNSFNLYTSLLTLSTALFLQLLSNLANDLGDFLKGTDTTGKRVGPTRSTQSGIITPLQMKRGILIVILLAIVSGLSLLLRLIETIGWGSIIIFVFIGFFSLVSALFYTLGKRPYGYRGWGDFFAFLFFGPIAVLGAYYLQTGSLNWYPILPSIGMGLLSAMILNVNNMRDIKNDEESGKITIAVKLGLRGAKAYHAIMTLIMFSCFTIYSILFAAYPLYKFSYVIVFIFQLYILYHIFKSKDSSLDSYLRKTAFSSFLLALSFSICINI